MTDVMTLLREADPAAGEQLDPTRIDRAVDALLTAEPALEPTAAPRTRAGRQPRSRSWTARGRPRWILAAGGLAGVAAVVALAAAPSDDGHHGIVPVHVAPADAKTALHQLGRTAAHQAPGTSRYVYQSQIDYTTHMRPRLGGKGTFATVVPTELEQWVARDGSGAVARQHLEIDKATYPTPQDAADGKASPLMDEPDQTWKYADVKIAGFTNAELQQLPTDPAALKQRFEHADLGGKSEAPVVTVASLVLSSGLTPPAVRAATFEVLRSLPGAQLLDNVKDPLGRSGLAVQFDTDSWRSVFVFDQQSSQLLAVQSVGHHELPGRDISDWDVHFPPKDADTAPEATTRPPVAIGGGD